MNITTTQLADALRAVMQFEQRITASPHDGGKTIAAQAREALAAYDARKPEPPSLADALRALREECKRSETTQVTNAPRWLFINRADEALAAYDAQQARQADAVALIREIALTEACGNSEPDVMARALDGIIGRCEGFIANHASQPEEGGHD